ncbi:hypothetical protein [Streptomyces sp. NPDC001222]|uniref:hypothetical protein n=1 Tax=Streptomyces sp. NPDC001222 TaxID=3364548 RepID=UPI00368A591D
MAQAGGGVPGPSGPSRRTTAWKCTAPFSDDAITLIHDTSRGYPRAVNNLAVQALLSAYADNKSIVDEASARAAVAEVTAE